MKLITVIAIAIIVSACSSFDPPEQKMIIDKNIAGMSRIEVINAINDCEDNETRAVMIYAKRKINGYTTDIVADVTCAPRRQNQY